MTREEKALIYFKDLREQKLKDYSVVFDTAPKDSVVYEAVSAEIEIYDTVIKVLEQKPVLDRIRAELIQSIQNGILKVESGNEALFHIIDKFKAESEK